jgi:hypothetical protein
MPCPATAISRAFHHPLMAHVPPNSQNHPPDDPPDDHWDEPEPSTPPPAGTILPPVRIKDPASASSQQSGLRIGFENHRAQPANTVRPLEVQEINGDVIRLKPELPEIQKVPRQVTFHERPKPAPADPARIGESKDWGTTPKHAIRWIIFISLGVTSVVILAMMMLPRINRTESSGTRPPQQTLVIDQPDEEAINASLNDMLTRQPEAEQIFRSFASSSVISDVLPLIRDAKTIESLIRENKCPFLTPKSWTPDDNTTWSVFETDGRTCGLLNGSLPDFSRFNAYFTLDHRHLLLDWKASTAYGTATFDELETSRGNPAEIRTTITPGTLYTLTFPETEFVCYQLISPDNIKSVWGYARRSEPAVKSLSRLFQGGDIIQASQDPKRVTLRLAKAPDGALPNQWLIAKMLHKDWITP